MKKLFKCVFVLCLEVVLINPLQAKGFPHERDPMECLFKDSVAFMHHWLSQDGFPHRDHFVRPLRWMECKKAYCLEVAIPGADKDDVKISVDESLLIIEAEVERSGCCADKEGDSKNSKKYSKDCDFKNPKRRFKFTTLLPSDGQVDKLDAKMKNGLLTLVLPKTSKPEAKKITIH
ncbi:MAG: Hsp20/alpha crystallin family protein [Puniceicoccales bacterium]|nr:Hsp20/alpha crystallin family protein [Puniceicoccales bacterium]